MTSWRPRFGACCEGNGVRFRVWAPQRTRVDVVLESRDGVTSVHPLTSGDGMFSDVVAGARAGDRYRYRLDGEGPYPDPASRFQPEGVHGPSEVVDASQFDWSDAAWSGVRVEDLVIYELHVGTFTPSGTFNGMVDRLEDLRDLGVTAIEIMPVADFPGSRSWGYDGVALFAPARCYGRPDDLRRVVDAAHAAGLGVILDVVYNHVGPEGNYLGRFSPYYFSKRHQTPWGDAVNFDGTQSDMVRAFFIENALHWVHEYHVDGLRLDATHALIDDSPRHFLAELTSQVRGSVHGRKILLIAEDHRNLSRLLRPEADGGCGLDAVWADDFHHQVRRALAGDREGYYADYNGSMSDLATTLRRGWFFCGQYSTRLRRPRGTDPSGLGPRRFVICLQNHDQVGNRAFGERLHHEIALAAYRAASVLLVCAPETPLLFMGQEWAATAPFLYFTDLAAELGKLVTQGRRREFAAFSAFADAAARDRIPDPQASATFLHSRLDFQEALEEPHASVRRLYRAALAWRRNEPLLRRIDWAGFVALPLTERALLLAWTSDSTRSVVVVVQMSGAETLNLGVAAQANEWFSHTHWEQRLSTEDPTFTIDPQPIALELAGRVPTVRFARPGAVVLQGTSPRVGGLVQIDRSTVA